MQVLRVCVCGNYAKQVPAYIQMYRCHPAARNTLQCVQKYFLTYSLEKYTSRVFWRFDMNSFNLILGFATFIQLYFIYNLYIITKYTENNIIFLFKNRLKQNTTTQVTKKVFTSLFCRARQLAESRPRHSRRDNTPASDSRQIKINCTKYRRTRIEPQRHRATRRHCQMLNLNEIVYGYVCGRT